MGRNRSWDTNLDLGSFQSSGDVKCSLSIVVDMEVCDENLPEE